MGLIEWKMRTSHECDMRIGSMKCQKCMSIVAPPWHSLCWGVRQIWTRGDAQECRDEVM